jgi:hypothetical protein
MVVGGFDDVADLLLRFFRFGEGQRAAAAGDFLLIAAGRFRADDLDHLVQVLRILEGFPVYAERTIGLAADVAGDLHAFQRFDDGCFHALEADVFDQHLDHVARLDCALEVEPSFLERFVGLSHQAVELVQFFGGLAGGEPASFIKPIG